MVVSAIRAWGAFVLGAQLSFAAVLYVDTSVSSSGDGSSWDAAYKTVQEAVTAASFGTDIWVADGHYDASNTIIMKQNVDLYGGFEGVSGTEGDFEARDPARFVTTLSGGGESRIMYGNHNTIVDGFVFSDGDGEGAAIVVAPILKELGSMTIENCVFFNCATPFTSGNEGGAIWANQYSLTIRRCAFIGCRSYEHGGAIYLFESSAQISDCTFSGNSSFYGPGGAVSFVAFASNDVSLQCTDTRFIGNRTGDLNRSSAGGAVAIYGGSAHVFERCSYSGNWASSSGGAINVQETFGGGASSISHCTVGGNEAGQAGGILIVNGGVWTVSNTSFAGNRSKQGLLAAGAYVIGGAMCIDGEQSVGIHIENCRFTDNVGESWGGALGVLDGAVTCVECRFERNQADSGGAVYARDTAEVRLARCYLLSNDAALSGSAIQFEGMQDTAGSPMDVVNCLIARNSAGNGTIRCDIGASSLAIRFCTVADNVAASGAAFSVGNNGLIDAVNCNIWGNPGRTIYEDLPPGSIVVSSSNVQTSAALVAGNGNIEQDPLFVNPAANDYNVSPNSPVIDAAVALQTPVTEDIRGLPRPQGANPDMGAYEGGSVLDSDQDGMSDDAEGTADTDNDGLSDNLDTDSDNDGLGDSIERNLDPDDDNIPNFRDLDSDDDGYSDQEEGVAGSNPYNAASFPGSDVRGSVQVHISPALAVEHGALWNVDSGGLFPTGAIVSDLTVGDHELAFVDLPNWRTPSVPTVTVQANQTTVIEAEYEPVWGRITVNSPNGGEEFVALVDTIEIRWFTNGLVKDRPVRIDLLDNGRNVLTIEERTPNDGRHNWRIPANQNLNGRRYTVRIKSTLNGDIKDSSDAAFTITSPRS